MELTGSACSEIFANGDDHGVESSDVLRVLRVDSGGLSLEDLDDRIAELGRVRSMIEGELALALAERAGRSSARAASAVLRERVLEAAGRRVSMALAKMAEAFRREETENSKITYLQRNADALVQMITRDGPQRATPASLLMIAEYDADTGELSGPRLDDGQPVPPEVLEQLLENAEVYTAFADAEGQPLWLGRSQRSASPAQRIMLAARDGGCIGCASTTYQLAQHSPVLRN